MFDINKFVDKFVNNKLNEVEDSSINDDEIHRILDKVKEIKKIDNDEIVQQLILDTSLRLPKISISIMSYYFYDQEILYQGLKNIYTNFIIKTKDKNLFFTYWRKISNIICYALNNIEPSSIQDYKESYEYEQKQKWWPDIFKKYYCKNFNFCIFSFSIKRWNKIFLYLSKVLIKLNRKQYKYQIFIEILMLMYSKYIQKYIPQEEQKRIVNVLVKLTIYIMENKYFYHDRTIRDYAYIKLFNIIISQWNLIYPRYQQIIKQNIDKWINSLNSKKHFKNQWKILSNVIIKL